MFILTIGVVEQNMQARGNLLCEQLTNTNTIFVPDIHNLDFTITQFSTENNRYKEFLRQLVFWNCLFISIPMINCKQEKNLCKNHPKID